MSGFETYDLSRMQTGEEMTPLCFTDKPDKKEWLEQRLGMITGSKFGKLVVKSKDKQSYSLSKSETATNLIYKIAWERLLRHGNISNGLGRLNESSKPMEHGNDYEGEAIQKYVEYTGNKVDYAQRFIRHDDYIGGTPDGFVGDDGIIEVKCPWNGGLHIKSLLTRQIYNTEYVYQIQGYLWITGRSWCDFITYDPDLIEGLQINVIRVERDESIIKGICLVMEKVKELIQEIMENKAFKSLSIQ